MITELALLRLLPGSAPAFERAFASVAPLLAGADGCLRYRLVPTLDDPDVYLLEVVWRDLAAHTQRAHCRALTGGRAVVTWAVAPTQVVLACRSIDRMVHDRARDFSHPRRMSPVTELP